MGCQTIEIRDTVKKINALDSLSELLLVERYVPEINLNMIIPFKSFTAEKYFERIRKSFKSLVNWGKKNLTIVYVNKDNLNKNYSINLKIFIQKFLRRLLGLTKLGRFNTICY